MGERLLKRGTFRTASKIYSVLGQRHGFRFECIKLGRFVSVCDQALSEQSDRIKLRQLLQLIGGTIAHSIPDEMPLKKSEEHTSELQSLMRISYAVFCLK